MHLHEPQKQIARSRARFRVVCCGRRFGKTTLAVLEMIGKAASKGGMRVCYISPTYQQSRDICWNMLRKLVDSHIISVNETRLEVVMMAKDGGKSTIVLRGWESIETLRGQAFDFMVVDEIAMMRNWIANWQQVLRPTLTDTKGSVLFISTPKGYNHFYDLFNIKDNEYESFHFTSYDNPHLPTGEIEAAKQQLTEDAFAQEYLADFRKATGLAHKYWNREIHVIPVFDCPREWQRARGFDYGSVDPTASVRVAIDADDTWFVERCYKNNRQTIEEHTNTIRSQDFGFSFVPCWGDPSGGQWFTEFSKYGLSIQPASKEGTYRSWVEHCVEKVNQRFKPVPGNKIQYSRLIENAPKLFVLDTSENQAIIQEFELLRWKETSQGVTVPILEETVDPNGHCDLLAALRYLAVSYHKPQPVKKYDGSKWEI